MGKLPPFFTSVAVRPVGEIGRLGGTIITKKSRKLSKLTMAPSFHACLIVRPSRFVRESKQQPKQIIQSDQIGGEPGEPQFLYFKFQRPTFKPIVSFVYVDFSVFPKRIKCSQLLHELTVQVLK